ncbi:MAG: hypothetical protein KJO54_02775 [Gammaproteobacteria bacterium]|nr:hypothetical protein [Gammaproteobacteria bacterium]NNF62200.1 hypothetical protein [Gammaproteobacteria bacterium]NNM20115.1 hypothetical protein [Gammaproteobacteria bacterium]
MNAFRTPLTLMFVALTGCLHGYGSVAALRADAETVFRQHNQVSSELMLALPGLDPQDPLSDALSEADRAMLAACEPLNELAIAHREGQAIPAAQRRKLPGTIAGCREATAATRVLLERLP